MSCPEIVFGCASIGKSFTSQSEVDKLVKVLQACNFNHLDTAARYPMNSPGLSEKLLGKAKTGDIFIIDTKILFSGDGRGQLTEAAIGKSIEQSYESLSLRSSKINILYCHVPDKQTPISEQAAAFDKFYREGKFKYVGNYLGFILVYADAGASWECQNALFPC